MRIKAIRNGLGPKRESDWHPDMTDEELEVHYAEGVIRSAAAMAQRMLNKFYGTRDTRLKVNSLNLDIDDEAATLWSRIEADGQEFEHGIRVVDVDGKEGAKRHSFRYYSTWVAEDAAKAIAERVSGLQAA